jgi:hypothetical protein
MMRAGNRELGIGSRAGIRDSAFEIGKSEARALLYLGLSLPIPNLQFPIPSPWRGDP